MRIDNAAKFNPFALTARRFSQEILILGEQHSLQLGSPIQQNRVGHVAPTVFLCRQDIYTSQA